MLKRILLSMSACYALLLAKPIIETKEPHLEDLQNKKAQYKDAPEWVFTKKHDLKNKEELGIANIPITNEKLGLEKATSDAKMRLILKFHNLFKAYRKELEHTGDLDEEQVDAIRAIVFGYLLNNTIATNTYVNKSTQTAVVKVAIIHCSLYELNRAVRKRFPSLNRTALEHISRRFKEKLGSICH
ncbi:hypothetical protein [Helicobacter cetorum]|uniref:Uncharacterized protein n=1 Tax=Helicobacter cetorum (strain ATCC BAA-429 / MIT 00-7128) TaxID=182217 RepID=I0ELG5_HELC0|nr:hypothetical protein [Helicobacter cetorum]AFI03784.1 hypothetical protein HCW_02515 [Helicobacter cetorum MIT 00-7128]